MSAHPLTDPLPLALELPDGYARHDAADAEVAAAVRRLVQTASWSELTWSQLCARLAALGRTDIPLARLAEGHVDALRILAQAQADAVPGALYGVWASRSLSSGLRAEAADDGFALAGTLRFASGAGVLERALVPALVGQEPAVLVDLDVVGLDADPGSWQTRAMAVSRSFVVQVHRRPVPRSALVGGPGFYLERPGFFPGGVGVAAVWAGGLCRTTDVVLGWLGARRWPAGELRLGRLRTHRATALAVVTRAAQRLDEVLRPDATPRLPLTAGVLQQHCALARAAVAAAVRGGLEEIRALAGPAGLAFDADLTRAVDDLDLYVGQQNADADAAFLGSTLTARDQPV